MAGTGNFCKLLLLTHIVFSRTNPQIFDAWVMKQLQLTSDDYTTSLVFIRYNYYSWSKCKLTFTVLLILVYRSMYNLHGASCVKKATVCRTSDIISNYQSIDIYII